MHIGIDARMYGIKYRGIGRYIQRLIQEFSIIDSGDRFTLFMDAGSRINPELDSGRFKIVYVYAPLYGWREQFKMPGLVRRSKIDLMHWTHLNVPIFCPVPYVVTIHDLNVWHFLDAKASTLPKWLYVVKRMVYKWILKNAAERAKKIITVSEFIKRDLGRQLKVGQGKIAVTYLGTEKMLFGTDKLGNSEAFARYLVDKFSITKPFLLYVGSAYPHKNLENLILAYNLLRRKYNRGWQLVLVGGNDYFYDRLRDYAVNNSNFSDDIIFTGSVTDNELDGLYRAAKAFVFPSLYEGFGLPPLEAMARGLPVLAAKIASLPEILGDAAYYFDAKDYSDMALAMDLVGKSQNVYSYLSKKGMSRAKYFDWNKTARATLEVYRQAGR